MLEGIIWIAYGVLLLMAGFMIRQLWFAIKHFTPPVYTSELGRDTDMPSVTICIPARNETHALTDCLDKVLASDYEKLEIIVLDDASKDNTSALIKSYASEGVRFVESKLLPSGWIGKNHALQGLLSEASGSYVLFMDVDTRISSDAISNIVRYAISQNASMVSILPRREDGWRASVIFAPLRYFWEIMFHTNTSPATASAAWLIRRKVLTERFNSFEDLKSSIQPESKLAALLATTNEYRFLMSTTAFGVAYEKKWRSQLITSTRLLFPLLGRKVSMAIMAMFDLAIMLVPAAVLLSLFVVEATLLHIVAAAYVLLFAGIFGWYVHRVKSKGALFGALLWPIIILQEIILVVASVSQYKRRTVQWKGRKILVGRQFEAE
jgi:glycosyltransferase involved in cell wall biosynthesis